MTDTLVTVTYEQWSMGRDLEYPPSAEVKAHAYTTISKINTILHDLDVTVEQLLGTHRKDDNAVSSGYRPGHYNKAAGGAARSAHLTGEAIDLEDPTGFLARKLVANVASLRRTGLYMEAPARTKGWVHLQSRPVPSGNVIFQP